MYESETGGNVDESGRDRGPCVCDTCGGPLDALGECPRCQDRAVLAKRLRIKQKVQDLFREIDRIVAKSW